MKKKLSEMDVLEIMQGMGKGIDWYNNDSMTHTPELLINLRRKLSTYSVSLTLFVKELSQEYETAYYLRKKEYGLELLRLGKENRTKTKEEKQIGDELKALAEAKVSSLVMSEIQAKSNYTQAKDFIRQCNEVLSSINQHVSFLKAERANSNINQT